MVPDLFEYNSKSLIDLLSLNEHLSQYFSMLREENKKINLVSRETIESGLEKLALESILPFEKIACCLFDNYLDIGSGGGFPSFPISIMKSIKSATLIERTGKKAAALKDFAKELNIESNIIEQNFDEIKFEIQFNLITMRLVKLSNGLLAKIMKLLKDDGIFVYYSFPAENINSEKFSFRVFETRDLAILKNDKLAQSKSFTLFANNRSV